MHPAAIALMIASLVALSLLIMRWHFARSRAMLQEWADEQGYELLSVQRRFIRRGPFFFTTTKGQEVFFVTLSNGMDQPHQAYVRVGGWLWGMWTYHVRIKWVD